MRTRRTLAWFAVLGLLAAAMAVPIGATAHDLHGEEGGHLLIDKLISEPARGAWVWPKSHGRSEIVVCRVRCSPINSLDVALPNRVVA